MAVFSPPRASALLCGAFLSLGSNAIVGAFSTSRVCGRRTAPNNASNNWSSSSHRRPAQRSIPSLFESNNDDESPSKTSSDTANNSPFQRFLSPRIDDPGLPLTDVLLAQIVAPTFQIYWIALTHAPNPTWLQPISSYFGEAPELAPRGSLLAPTLIHGAGLAVCWIAGALAAKMYERDAFMLKDALAERKSGGDGNVETTNNGRESLLDVLGKYDTIIVRLFQAGAFASGILIVSTQLDLLLEFKGHFVQYGESQETDLRLAVATVEVMNDIFWEALLIASWRIIHANFMSTPSNRSRRF